MAQLVMSQYMGIYLGTSSASNIVHLLNTDANFCIASSGVEPVTAIRIGVCNGAIANHPPQARGTRSGSILASPLASLFIAAILILLSGHYPKKICMENQIVVAAVDWTDGYRTALDVAVPPYIVNANWIPETEMPVTADNPGPYAPASAVLETLDRYRSRGLATPITNEVLERIGVSESLCPRTLNALQALDLIDGKGMPTPTFEGLRLALEAEYQQRLADWLKAAYAEVFSFVDPTEDDEARIRDAFRNYRPHAQQNRMVTLFTGLCTAAGLMREPRQAPRAASASRPRSQPRRPTASAGAGSRRQPSGTLMLEPSGRLPPALAGLLASLPAEGTWTKERRDKFVATFESVLDYSFAIVKPNGDKENGGT